MRNRANRKQLNKVMKKALTQVGAFLVNHNAVRFEQEWLGVSMIGIIL
jgi:S-adenosylmethionine/arginine decarboxylase-like enzyme